MTTQGNSNLTPHQIREARQQMGVSVADLAKLLRMGENGGRKIRRWEDGIEPITGPASVAIEALVSGWRPV